MSHHVDYMGPMEGPYLHRTAPRFAAAAAVAAAAASVSGGCPPPWLTTSTRPVLNTPRNKLAKVACTGIL